MLQIAPSKTDAERLLLVSPELGEVLAEVIGRVRGGRAVLPLVSAYDPYERIWSPPMPFLFQRPRGPEHRAISRTTLRQFLNHVLAVSGLTDASNRPLVFTPHDFRRLFATDALRSGSRRTSPPRSSDIPTSAPPWDTPRSTPKTSSPTTAPSSPAGAPCAPAKNTATSPRKNGTSSCTTSSSERSLSGSAPGTLALLVPMSTAVSGARSSGLIRPRTPAAGDPRQPPGPHHRSPPRRLARRDAGLEATLQAAEQKLQTMHQIASSPRRHPPWHARLPQRRWPGQHLTRDTPNRPASAHSRQRQTVTTGHYQQ